MRFITIPFEIIKRTVFDKVLEWVGCLAKWNFFLPSLSPKIDAHRSQTAAGNFSTILADNSLLQQMD